MDKKSSEFAQTVLFVIIVFGQIFLANRYYSRDDLIGMTIFIIVAVLAGIAAFGHFFAWRNLSKKITQASKFLAHSHNIQFSEMKTTADFVADIGGFDIVQKTRSWW